MTKFETVFDLFGDWFNEAKAKEPELPEAVAVASVDGAGRPSMRMVLLKEFSPEGFIFYTNFESRKGQQLQANPNAAMLFHWKSLNRQIRIEGTVSRVSDEKADAYFASRPKDAQIGAWASQQSRPMEGRFEFEAAIAKFAAKYAVGAVPRPPHWSGFCLKPTYVEFWKDRKFRLHERRVFTLNENENTWDEAVLYP